MTFWKNIDFLRFFGSSLAGLCLAVSASATEPSAVGARNQSYRPEFPPCEPASEPAMDVVGTDIPTGVNPLPDLAFCSRWNPEFTFNGHHCCGKGARGSRKKRRLRCSLERAKGTYCGEITAEQEEYTDLVKAGKLGDILDLISYDIGQKGAQSYCTVNNGFLAWGRRLIPSDVNKIVLRAPQRCTEFGTDPMIGMLEWLGREVARDYSSSEYEDTRLVIGDISAPRGGCLSGRGGRRGHLSHTTGQDVDISFLSAKEGKASPVNFHRQFDAKQNWYLLKKMLNNPYACVKVVFLDRRLISKLAKAAGVDEDWGKYRRFVRHMPGHRNHFHVRVGEGPGAPGCVMDANPDLELEEIGDEPDFDLSEQGDDVLSEIQMTSSEESSGSLNSNRSIGSGGARAKDQPASGLSLPAEEE